MVDYVCAKLDVIRCIRAEVYMQSITLCRSGISIGKLTCAEIYLNLVRRCSISNRYDIVKI